MPNAFCEAQAPWLTPMGPLLCPPEIAKVIDFERPAWYNGSHNQETRPMRPLRRPLCSTIHYHGRTDDGDTHSVTFSINGVRWEYFLCSQQADDCIYIIRKAGAAKGLAYAKRWAASSRCLDIDARLATLLRNRGGIASRAKRIKVTLPNV